MDIILFSLLLYIAVVYFNIKKIEILLYRVIFSFELYVILEHWSLKECWEYSYFFANEKSGIKYNNPWEDAKREAIYLKNDTT